MELRVKKGFYFLTLNSMFLVLYSVFPPTQEAPENRGFFLK
jgi:hypothetical protein